MLLKLGLIGITALAVISATYLFGGKVTKESEPTMDYQHTKAAPGSQTLVIGGGCFWCVEAVLESLKGVSEVESGYAGGDKPNVTYEEVCDGNTGHAEAVKVTFDPKVISADDILRIFFTSHNPTTLNRQGNDSGTQYRSVVFYSNAEEKARAERIIKEISEAKIWPDKIVTTVEPLKNYTRAEEYHQNYFEKFEKATPAERARMNGGYCSAIIEPKVREFRAKYAAKLKKG
jgi:peptide-methionine (S)-S-oxide reductase